MNDADALIEPLVAGRLPNDAGWYRVNCPFCENHFGKADNRQSLGVHQQGPFKCFRCGTRGFCRSVADSQTTFFKPKPQNKKPIIGPPSEYVEMWSYDGLNSVFLKPARDYLIGRGITQDTWEGLKLGACATGFYNWRIVIPVIRPDGTWAGWAARDWTGQQKPKYLYPKGMARGFMLFNESALYVETEEPVLAVEGGFDAAPYFPNCVAFFGKPVPTQVDILLKTKRPISVVLDPDASREAIALVMRLRLEGIQAGWVPLPPKEDPNTVDPDWLKRRSRECIFESI